jgi:hypothetical protein
MASARARTLVGARPRAMMFRSEVICQYQPRSSWAQRSVGSAHHGNRRKIAGESEVRLQAFVFDRQAVGKLVLSLWTFVREHRGLITRSDGAGDIRVTVDFSHVIPPAHLDAQVELLKRNGNF